MIKKVLTIAGSDSGGCAGIQADIKSISANGGFATSVITAATSQNTLGVTYFENLSLKSIETQIDAVLSDIGTDAIKTGMLASTDIISLVAKMIRKYSLTKYVLDPVMVAASGAVLIEDSAIDTIKKELLPLATVVTPNIAEAEILSGIKINSKEDIKEAAKIIYSYGSESILIKGGHLKSDKAVDILYNGSTYIEYSADWVETTNTHGTGCTYAAAIATYLAKDYTIDTAISAAKIYITEALKFGKNLSIGSGSGPVNHFYNMK